MWRGGVPAEIARTGHMGLPDRIECAVAELSGDAASDGLSAVVTDRGDGGFDACVVDDAGRVQVALRGYRTIELPVPVSPEQIAPLNDVAG